MSWHPSDVLLELNEEALAVADEWHYALIRLHICQRRAGPTTPARRSYRVSYNTFAVERTADYTWRRRALAAGHLDRMLDNS